MTDYPESPQPESSMFSLDNIIFMVFRRKWLLLLGVVTGLGAAAAAYVLTPRFFASEAKLLVRYVNDNTALDPRADDEGVMRPRINVLSSEIEILGSFSLAEEVVRRVGVRNIFPPKEGEPAAPEPEAAAALRKGLKIEVPRDSNILRLEFTAIDPAVAQRVLDTWVQAYLDKHREIHSAVGAYDYFTQKTDQLRSELRETEERLRKLKHAQGVIFLDDTKKALGERLEQVSQTIDVQEGLLAAQEARVGWLAEHLGEKPRDVDSEATGESEEPGDPVAELQARLAMRQLGLLRDSELKLLSTYTPDSAVVRSIQEQIRQAENQLQSMGLSVKSERTGLVGSADSGSTMEDVMIQSRADVAAARAQIEVLKAQKETAEAKLRRLNETERQIVELQRERELQEAAYRRFSDALDSAKNALALAPEQLSNIIEIQPATLPLEPSQSNRKKTVMMAAMAGFGLFGGIAFLLELIGLQVLRRPVEVEKVLRVPTLMTFPDDRVFRRPFALNGSGKLLKPAGRGGNQGEVEGDRTLAEPVHAYYESLCSRLERTGVLGGDIPHLVGLTSCAPQSGTTTVATGLALAMSQHDGEQVLLIDGNLGGGGAHRVLGLGKSETLSQALLNGAQDSGRVQDGLFLLSTANGDQRHARISLGRRFREFVDYLKKSNFTNVVVDLPPVDETSTTLQMAGLLDGVILVVESEKVSHARAEKALKMLRDANANVVGVVFNKQRKFVPAWLDVGG